MVLIFRFTWPQRSVILKYLSALYLPCCIWNCKVVMFLYTLMPGPVTSLRNSPLNSSLETDRFVRDPAVFGATRTVFEVPEALHSI